MVYFVPSTLGFIPAAWKDDGTYPIDCWPSEAVLLTDDEREVFWRQPPPAGKTLGADGGRPTWIMHDDALSTDERGARERAWRDEVLASMEWLVNRHRDELDMRLATTLTAEQFAELLVYRQALRDWPQSEAFPDTEMRPIAPILLAELEGMR